VTDDQLNTRQRILHLLRRRGPMTAQELGRVLKMSVSGVRQHASVLEKESLIGTRVRKNKLGRPGHEYVLSPESEDQFPKGYKELARALLVAASEIGGDELVRKLLNHRREQTYREYEKLVRDLPLEEKMAVIAKGQDRRGQMAHVERHDDELRLVHYNCLTHELSAWREEFCESDRRMFEKLLGIPVKMEGCRARGGDCCCFSVHVEPGKKPKKK
jgi:predicted ArsR family transcriptional regulator